MRNHVLSEVVEGQSFVVTDNAATGGIRKRLNDIGLVKGAVVLCAGAAPTGDPRAYRIRDSVIAIRREDAKNITVTPLKQALSAEQKSSSTVKAVAVAKVRLEVGLMTAGEVGDINQEVTLC